MTATTTLTSPTLWWWTDEYIYTAGFPTTTTSTLTSPTSLWWWTDEFKFTLQGVL